MLVKLTLSVTTLLEMMIIMSKTKYSEYLIKNKVKSQIKLFTGNQLNA